MEIDIPRGTTGNPLPFHIEFDCEFMGVIGDGWENDAEYWLRECIARLRGVKFNNKGEFSSPWSKGKISFKKYKGKQ